MYYIFQEYVTGTSGQESSSDEHILENVRATEAQVNLLCFCAGQWIRILIRIRIICVTWIRIWIRICIK
jgi:hypothetical protein